MMEALRQYFVAVTAAAIICGIAKSIGNEKTTSGAMLRLIAGIAMTITVISPVVRLDIGSLPELADNLAEEAGVAAAVGEEMAVSEMNTIIIKQVEAYILDKAAMFGASLRVEIFMPEDGSYQPEYVILRGAISPYGRTRLETIIAEDLRISKENQQWIG